MGEPDPIAQKVAFTFTKTGASRFYSHHDLMRHVERSLRRAGLKPRLTAGFNPQPRVVFPHALSLGVSSACERVEIEFVEKRPGREVFALFQEAARPVIEVTAWEVMLPVKGGRQPEEMSYRLSGWPDGANLEDAVAALLSKDSVKVERGTGEKRREVDLRPYLVSAEAADGGVDVKLRHTTTGAGRIDEIAKALAETLGLDWAAIQMHKTGVRWA